MKEGKKLIVIGGGASGFFCAVNAARLSQSLEVHILEKSSKLLAKVKISGGGRCNVTHESKVPEDMIDAYPRGRNFVRKTLHQFHTTDTVTWFNERGVQLKVEPDGRMFPSSDESQTIIDCMINEANRYGVKIHQHAEVRSIEKKGNVFQVLVSDQRGEFNMELADFVCVATGGQPKASSFDWLKKIGHGIEEPVPSLFTFNIPDKRLHELMGVACQHASVKIPSCKMHEEGPVLITHWGLSGPAVLRLSAKAARELHKLDYHFIITLNWAPALHESAMLEKLKSIKHHAGSLPAGNKNTFGLSARLWHYLLLKSGIAQDQNWSRIPQSDLARLSKTVCNDNYTVSGKTTFKEEFVTAGGIKLDEIDAKTMQSNKIPGLFFTGEVMNVDGITGGYNFQHAWSSGWIAANAISTLA